MSADIVNLRTARKAKTRAERDKAAADNRVAFGRTKAEKKATEAERRRAVEALEAHRRDDPEPT
jgi:hypothetical protein